MQESFGELKENILDTQLALKEDMMHLHKPWSSATSDWQRKHINSSRAMQIATPKGLQDNPEQFQELELDIVDAESGILALLRTCDPE